MKQQPIVSLSHFRTSRQQPAQSVKDVNVQQITASIELMCNKKVLAHKLLQQYINVL